MLLVYIRLRRKPIYLPEKIAGMTTDSFYIIAHELNHYLYHTSTIKAKIGDNIFNAIRKGKNFKNYLMFKLFKIKHKFNPSFNLERDIRIPFGLRGQRKYEGVAEGQDGFLKFLAGKDYQGLDSPELVDEYITDIIRARINPRQKGSILPLIKEKNRFDEEARAYSVSNAVFKYAENYAKDEVCLDGLVSKLYERVGKVLGKELKLAIKNRLKGIRKNCEILPMPESKYRPSDVN